MHLLIHGLMESKQMVKEDIHFFVFKHIKILLNRGIVKLEFVLVGVFTLWNIVWKPWNVITSQAKTR